MQRLGTFQYAQPAVRHRPLGWVRAIRRACEDLIFPPTCQVCGRELEQFRQPLICAPCKDEICDVNSSRCTQCARKLIGWDAIQAQLDNASRRISDAKLPEPSSSSSETFARTAGRLSSGKPPATLCTSCQQRSNRFQVSFCLGDYQNSMRAVVRQMKRAHQEGLIAAIGHLLGDELQERGAMSQFDWVVPMPAQRSRRFQRWHNIAELLAEAIAERTRIALRRNLLKYIRSTQKQGTLSRRQRFENLRGSMKTRDVLTEKSILIVDDVLTSGATASEAARVCRQAGASWVGIAVVARGRG